MGIILKTEDRRVIPIWRSIEFINKVASKGLLSNKSEKSKVDKETISGLIKQFNKNKNIYNAGDVLSSAHVLDIGSEFKEIAKFVLDKASDDDLSLRRLASDILNLPSSDNTQGFLSEGFDWGGDSQMHNYYVKKYRAYLKREPKNPLAWTEMARHYVLIGNIEKAVKSINTALSLDSNNRFVVRAASRFFHHYSKNSDLPLQIIRKSEFVKEDPLLISAEIAFSSLLNKKSKFIDNGIRMHKMLCNNPFLYSELASALGTYELDKGEKGKAKKFFNDSLIAPTDNSLAQAKWISEKIEEYNFDLYKYQADYAFEAKTINFFREEKFEDSLLQAKHWLEEEPYSSRPIKFGSYVSGIFLNKNNESVDLIRKGLKYDKDDIMLINDLIYFLVRANRIEEAIKEFNSKMHKVVVGIDSIKDNQIKATLLATTGLLLYRDGNPEEGKRLYNGAIDIAKNRNNQYLEMLALVNLLREEFLCSKDFEKIQGDVIKVSKYLKMHKVSDIEMLFKEFFSLTNVDSSKYL